MSKIETVVSMNLSRNSNNEIVLDIEDQHSGDNIIKVGMTLKELGLLVTGLYGVKGVATVYPEANIAKKREIKRVTCKKDWDKTIQKGIVKEDFFVEGYAQEGWIISDDGTRSQQNVPDEHTYTLKRYVPVEDVFDVERYY